MKKTIKSVMVLISGSAAGHLCSIVFIPFISRLFSPEEIGVLGWVLSVSVVLGTVCSGQLYHGIYIEEKKLNKNRLLITSVKLSFVVSFVFFVLLLSSMPWYRSEYVSYLFICIMLGFFYSIYSSIQVWLAAQSNYKLISNLMLLKVVFVSVSQIVAGLVFEGTLALLLSALVGEFVFLLVMIRLARLDFRGYVCFSPRDAYFFKKHCGYVTGFMPSQAVALIVNSSPVYFISLSGNMVLLGAYVMLVKLIIVPVSSVSQSVRFVFWNYVKSQKGIIKPLLSKLIFLGYASVMVVGLFFWHFEFKIVSFFLGELWVYCDSFLPYILIWALSSFLNVFPIEAAKNLGLQADIRNFEFASGFGKVASMVIGSVWISKYILEVFLLTAFSLNFIVAFLLYKKVSSRLD